MLGAVVLEDAPEVGKAADRGDVADEDRSPDDPFDQPEEDGGTELVLDQAGQPDRDDEEEPDREGQRERDGQAPGEAADRLLVLVHLRVRGERERPEADLQRLGEGDDAADHGDPQDPVPPRPRDDRLGGDLDLAVGGADGGGPGRDAAHHHPLEDRLTADRRVARGDRLAVRHRRGRPV